jgi:general secretion pathway protein F
MPVYEYKAIARATGKNSRGVIDAESAAQARQKLRDQDLYPTSLAEAAAGAQARGRGAKGGEAATKASRGRVAPRDVALMTRQLAVLLRAGMPLVEALAAMLEQIEKPALQSALYDIREKVNGGGQLGDAMAAHPRIFSNLYTNMVRAGEVSGSLEQVLVRLADLQEHQSKLRSQVYASLAYPVFMGIFAFGVVIFLMMVIVPRITMIFKKQEMELPQLTEVMISVSAFVGSYWWLVALIVFGLFTAWRTWVGRPEGKRRWDRWKLRFPLYGKLHQKLVCARFCRTLGTMLQSGLTMLPALDVVSKVLDNAHVQNQMEDVKAGVRRGRDLAVPLKETGLFPPMMIHMIELGQRSGEIEDMLIKVSDTYDEDVRLTIDALVGLMEPIIIIIMGLFVGVLVLSILLPIINMSSSLRN